MQVYKLKRKKLNLKEFVKRTALETDANIYIDHDAVIVDEDTNEVMVIYKVLDDTPIHKEVFKLLTKIKYQSSMRMSGLKNLGETKVFGYVPRMRAKTTDQACRIAKLAKDDPTAHQKLLEYAKVISDVYKDNDENRFNRHQELSKKTNKGYVIPGTLFTSGIINKNNPLKYHYDSGNYEKVSSAMIAFRYNIDGGNLALPEYDVKLAIQDRSVTLFDGQSLLHGVTPIIRKSPDAMRFTTVFYSLVGMWKCLPIDEEIADARMSRWESELKKYERKFGIEL